MPTYQQLGLRHPLYRAHYWEVCRALYAGGQELLGNPAILEATFPRARAEEDEVYEERKRRACYIPYAGEILDQIVAALTSDPVALTSEPQADAFYEQFIADCSMPAGTKQSLPQLLREQMLTALICGRAWTLVDLPPAAVLAPPLVSLADEERAGALAAYAVAIDPACVVDWEEDVNGELQWALTMTTERRRSSLDGDRSVIREIYTLYTPSTWRRYVVEYKADKPPKPTDEIPLAAEGELSAGRVPLVRLELPSGLWAMNKLESIARAHFNLRNATSWGELKSLFPILTAFMAPPPLSEMGGPADDPKRAVNQRVGPGRVFQLGDKDRLEYVSPNPGAFAEAQADLSALRDEMHRVVVQMALSVDNSGAALQRSAASKQVDKSATLDLLRAYGRYLREHAEDVVEMVEAARRDAPVKWSATGAEKYDEKSISDLVNESVALENVSIPSATFQVERKFSLAKRLLGADATEALLKQIREELEQNITNENYLPIPRGPVPGAEDDEADDEADDKKPPADEDEGEIPDTEDDE